MRTTSDCLPCFLRQALGTARRSTTDPARHWQLVGEVGALLAGFDPQLSPPENAIHFYRLIAARTGAADPFAAEKVESNGFARGLEARTGELIRASSDPLRTALQFAISANVLDYGAQHLLDRDEALAACRRPLTIDHSAALCARLEPGADILYLADNCGEIVFDRLVVEQLLARGCRVTVAVRSQPIINDATRVDAVACGLDQLCEVIDSGSDAPGTPLALCSPDFRARFAAADCIIAKGMGNFESLSDAPAPLFFLFVVKCATVLAHLRARFPEAGLRIGSPVLLRGEAAA